MAPKTDEKVEEKFDWIQLRQDMGHTETTKEKLMRKMKSNPVVPIGCLITACVLGMGLKNFSKGDMAKSQKFMRLRVAAQGLTVAALLGGMVIAAWKITPEDEDSK